MIHLVVCTTHAACSVPPQYVHSPRALKALMSAMLKFRDHAQRVGEVQLAMRGFAHETRHGAGIVQLLAGYPLVWMDGQGRPCAVQYPGQVVVVYSSTWHTISAGPCLIATLESPV